MNEMEFIFKNDIVNIAIDGISLIEIIRDIELPMAQEEGHPDLAGDYVIISPENPKEYFLGIEENHWGDDDDKSALLECVCRNIPCKALLCKIEVGDTIVTWKKFERIPRRWNYSTFGGFSFRKDQYRNALSKIPN